MAYPRPIRSYNASIDGGGYFGRVETATLPNLQLQTEEFRGAGMDIPVAVDMGMQAMTAELAFQTWSPELFSHFGTRTSLVLTPASMGEDSFDADSHRFTLRGRWSGLEPGQVQQGSKSLLTLTCSVDRFKYEQNDEELIFIDNENAVRRIGGVDQLEGLRRAMGI